jgi:D-alanyl-D-alanine-carboxypeptidase/D-alanyl-D-alanine-endopeptidase
MMRLHSAAIFLVVTLVVTDAGAQGHFPSDAEIQALTRRGVPVAGKGGVVIGLLDADGSRRVVPVADVPYDGGTLFEIGSITKTFTGILLGEMAERGEVRLEDPVQDLLPKGTMVPARNGRAIRLIDLASHASGLPRMPDNFAPSDPRNPYADYTADRLYTFLRGHQLTRDVGQQVEYSNLGAGLLAHALTVRAGKSDAGDDLHARGVETRGSRPPRAGSFRIGRRGRQLGPCRARRRRCPALVGGRHAEVPGGEHEPS